MARVITFSTAFPAYHPKKGQPTHFSIKVLNGEKKHTIRAGNRWKVGDYFSPRVWTGVPYRSKQGLICPDMEIKKVWDFEIRGWEFYVNGEFIYKQFVSIWHDRIELIAANDGLKIGDFYSWFKCPTDFKGQIICWDESVNY